MKRKGDSGALRHRRYGTLILEGVSHEKEDYIGFDYYVVCFDGGALECVRSGSERGKQRGENAAANRCTGANPFTGGKNALGGADTGRADGDPFTGTHGTRAGVDSERAGSHSNAGTHRARTGADTKATGGDASGISG